MGFCKGLSLLLVLAAGCSGASKVDEADEHVGESEEALTTRTLSITVPSGVRPRDLATSRCPPQQR